jgi:hypothetical protein
MTNSTSLAGAMPSFCRTLRGIVTCPLLVTFMVAFPESNTYRSITLSFEKVNLPDKLRGQINVQVEKLNATEYTECNGHISVYFVAFFVLIFLLSQAATGANDTD